MAFGSSPADRPPISIVIPSHSRADLLRRCLATVVRHAPVGSEILIVDDASKDSVISQAAAEYSGVRVVRQDRQSGFCAAANRGIAESRADVVELLNDDTEVEPGWVEAALRCFADPRVVAVAPLVLQIASVPERVDSAGDSYHIAGFAQKQWHGSYVAGAPAKAMPVFGASASSAFYRRDALVNAGMFSESLGSYFEDVDLSFRLRRAGGEIVFEPASRVRHHAHASYGRTSRSLLERQSRNEEQVFWRNMPASELWRAIPLHALALLAKGWRRWREGTLLPFAVGRLRAACGIREILDHRRRLHELGPAERLLPFLDRRLKWM